MRQGLGTQLRHLIELLDGAVEDAYMAADLLDYRPRYTPVMRVLSTRGEVTIGEIATLAGITQPAATQTVALMHKQGWILIAPGADDARQRVVSLSAKGSALLPRVQECWRATKMAADSLDAELEVPLSQTLAQAIEALAQRSFGQRIQSARRQLQDESETAAMPATTPSPGAGAAAGRPRKKKAA